MAEALDIDAFIERSRTVPILDVRTPAEYRQAHIPGALNLPLFSDEERAEIGTLYKQRGREAALLRGLDLVGPRMRNLLEAAGRLAGGREVLVHCWRGGMRSESVAWLLSFSGYRVQTLRGGYKAFRHYVLETFEAPRTLHVLSGKTGAGKTEVLRILQERGEQVVDLERLAHHRGSVFGGLGQPVQPAQEHFENRLALLLRTADPSRPLWVEDESRRIGKLSVPASLWKQMQQADLYVLETPAACRLERLLRLYGGYERARLEEGIRAVARRLGGLNTKHALEALHRGDLAETCRILLDYYDRAYLHARSSRNPSRTYRVNAPASEDAGAAAEALLAGAG